MGQPSLWGLFLGNLEGGSFYGAPEGYERKALGMGISPYGGSDGQLGVGSSTGDYETWLKVALGVWCLSLWELCEGNPEGALPFWGPWKTGREGSGDGHLFP
jgi:hypothetical protein